MCTQINDGHRDINELLTATTYQGMTDDEIDRIVEYKANHMFAMATAKADYAATMLQVANTEERNANICKQMEQMVESHLERVRARRTVPHVQPKIITFDSMEV